MADNLTDHLCNAVINSKVESSPFCHYYALKLFPDDIYDNMLASIPSPDMFEVMKRPRKGIFREDASPTRTTFDLNETNLGRLSSGPSELWTQVATAIGSKRYWDIVIEALRPGLRERYGDNRVDGVCYCSLYRDEHGYGIKPHPDVYRKIITMQFYLPKDDSQKTLGTHLYKRRGNGFIKRKTFDFLPNTGYAFAVNSQSYHGRETIPDDVGIRHTITTFLKIR